MPSAATRSAAWDFPGVWKDVVDVNDRIFLFYLMTVISPSI